MHKQLVEKMLNSLVVHEPHTVQDIKNQEAIASVRSVMEYLLLHQGQPAQVESLAKARHEQIRKLIRPFFKKLTRLFPKFIRVG